MITINWFTKEQYYLLYNSTIKAIDLSKIFLCNIWYPYRLPDTIISDRGALFIAKL
jgi:hypothetical protein